MFRYDCVCACMCVCVCVCVCECVCVCVCEREKKKLTTSMPPRLTKFVETYDFRLKVCMDTAGLCMKTADLQIARRASLLANLGHPSKYQGDTFTRVHVTRFMLNPFVVFNMIIHNICDIKQA